MIYSFTCLRLVLELSIPGPGWRRRCHGSVSIRSRYRTNEAPGWVTGRANSSS